MKLKRRINIHPPVTNDEAYAIGRQLLGLPPLQKKRRKLKRRKRK